MDINSNSTFSVLPSAQPRYHGRQSDPALLRISHGDQRLLVRGTVSTERIEAGKVTFPLKEMRLSQVCKISPDFPGYVEFLAISVRSKKRVLVRGTIEKVLRSKSGMVAEAKKKCMSYEDYAEELRRVKSARIADADAMVSIQFISRHTGRAVSSIYRDIKNNLLPKAIKQGGSSRWSFTAVEAYANGKAVEMPSVQSEPPLR